MVLIQIGLVLLPVIFNFNILTMEKITQILKRKEPHFRYIAPQCSLDEALNRMSCEATDHLAVIDEDRRFIGIITEHDIACRALVSKIPLTSTPVKKMLNVLLPIASLDDTVEQCLQKMEQYHVKVLPVFEGMQFKGIITADDILHEAASNRAEIFDQDETAVIY